MTDPLHCNECVEIVTDYIEDAMSDGERRRFETHLGECPYCIEYVEQMRAVKAGLREAATESLAPERRATLLDSFRDLRKR